MFKALGYKNMIKLLRIRSTDKFKQVGVRAKMTEMRSIAVEGRHLRNHLLITCGYPFW